MVADPQAMRDLGSIRQTHQGHSLSPIILRVNGFMVKAQSRQNSCLKMLISSLPKGALLLCLISHQISDSKLQGRLIKGN